MCAAGTAGRRSKSHGARDVSTRANDGKRADAVSALKCDSPSAEHRAPTVDGSLQATNVNLECDTTRLFSEYGSLLARLVKRSVDGPQPRERGAW